MNLFVYFLFLLSCILLKSHARKFVDRSEHFKLYDDFLKKPEETDSHDNFTIKGTELIRDFVEYFKNPDAANMPLPIPDPMVMPDRIYPILTFKVSTTNVTAFDVSRIRLLNFTTDAVEMKVHFVLRMPKLSITGNYSFYGVLMEHYFGCFNISLTGALNDCNAKLEVTRDGKLAASEISMDLYHYEKMNITFENGGVVGFLVNTFGDAFFYAIKPYFLSLISANIRNNLNEYLNKLKIMFPNSIQPLDLAIAEGRKFVKKSGFDPYYIPDAQHTTGMYNIDITHTVLTGLSSFYRIGDVKMFMDNHIINMIMNVGTEELQGSCNWEAGIGGFLIKTGSSSFTVDYIDSMISLNQSLDVRKKPQVIDLNVRVGNIQLRMDGAGIIDYISEAVVNVLPNLVRHQILQAAETPIKKKLQSAMDSVDVEQWVMNMLPIIDKQLYKKNDLTVIEASFDEEVTQLREKEDDFDIFNFV